MVEKMVLTKVASSTKSMGPGMRPWTRNAPSIMAVMGSPGIPSVRTGIRAPPVTELLDDSEAMTPSIWPLPNFSGVLEARFVSE